MLGNFFRRKAGEIGKDYHLKQIEEYNGVLTTLTDIELAHTVAFSAVIRRQLLKKDPTFDSLLTDDYSRNKKRLINNTLALGSLAKQLKKADRLNDLAGLLVWLQTFRCLCHPEFKEYGVEMWSQLSKGIDSIETGLFSLLQDGTFSVAVMDEVRKYADYIPPAYAPKQS